MCLPILIELILIPKNINMYFTYNEYNVQHFNENTQIMASS